MNGGAGECHYGSVSAIIGLVQRDKLVRSGVSRQCNVKQSQCCLGEMLLPCFGRGLMLEGDEDLGRLTRRNESARAS